MSWAVPLFSHVASRLAYSHIFFKTTRERALSN